MLHYDDQTPLENVHESAHPLYDPRTKELIGHATTFNGSPRYNIYSMADGTTKRNIIASFSTNRPSYIHSFTITPRFVILTGTPFTSTTQRFAQKNIPIIHRYEWDQDLKTEMILIDRIHGTVTIYEAEPFFTFHHVNAYEANSTTIYIDTIDYPDAHFMHSFGNIERRLAPSQSSSESSVHMRQRYNGTFKRYKIDQESGVVTSQRLSSTPIEMPRINDNFIGLEYNFAYGVAKKDSMHHNALIKVNLKTGHEYFWHQEQCYPNEPVFVAHPNAQAEDDGVILSTVLDVTKNGSFLVILDAQSFIELARAQLPHHIPFALHALFNQTT